MAEYYNIIYIVLITILSIAVLPKYGHLSLKGTYRRSVREFVSAKWLCLFFIVFIGTRPAHAIFGDMILYYNIIEDGVWSMPLFNPLVENLLFDNLINFWAYSKLSPRLFFLLIAFIYFGGILYTCHRLFPGKELLSFLVYVAAFSTFSYSVNGIKAGAAASIFLVVLTYYDRYLIVIPLMLISWGMHHSMIMPILAYVCVMFVKNPKYYFVFWFFCLIMCVGHVTVFQHLFANYTNEKATDYLMSTGNDWEGRGGLRLDFIFYSLMPVLLGWISTYKLKLKNVMFYLFLRMYLICNGLWMLCMYVNYNNRIAYLSWFLYPFVLLLSSLNPEWHKNGYLSTTKIASLHLLFTLFMIFIYY